MFTNGRKCCKNVLFFASIVNNEKVLKKNLQFWPVHDIIMLQIIPFCYVDRKEVKKMNESVVNLLNFLLNFFQKIVNFVETLDDRFYQKYFKKDEEAEGE